jgi:formylglycine-generating enzyme required for sulfatase activity
MKNGIMKILAAAGWVALAVVTSASLTGCSKADGGDAGRAVKTKTITLPGGMPMEMVWCPPGTFMMGSPASEILYDRAKEDEVQHQVTLTKGFWMAKTEVTQEQWISVMGYNPSLHKSEKLPVEQVSWEDCMEFCQKTGLDLPTEAEWEYACRAGTAGPYAGNGTLEDMAWYSGNSELVTHTVGQKRPNAWGLYDMHGNVWEWCADWYDDYPSDPETDPTGAGSGYNRVLRGGSYWHDASSCRSALRRRRYPDSRDGFNGFRPVARPD